MPTLSVSLEIAAHSAAGRGTSRNGVTADARAGEEKMLQCVVAGRSTPSSRFTASAYQRADTSLEA